MKAPPCLLLAFFLPFLLSAQDDEVQLSLDVPYAVNISILTGLPTEDTLLMDVYEPENGPAGRPVVLCLHEGYFIPSYFNGLPFGNRRDSTVVETCRRFAAQGYVAIAPDYRLGWHIFDDKEIRFSTHLQAVYRAAQDVRAGIRYLRKTVAEEGNPYQIDPNRIVVLGFGSGGHAALAAGYLDQVEELFLPPFFDPEVAQPYIDTAILGNLYGTSTAPLCRPNHPEYCSAFNMVVNIGGAIGDTSWIDTPQAGSIQPPLVSFHVVSNPFIPYTSCSPIPLHFYLYIQTLHGSRLAQGRANNLGVNDILNDALSDGSPTGQFLNQYVTSWSPVPFQYISCLESTYATEHLYPFFSDPAEPNSQSTESSPWNWWSESRLQAEVDSLNALFGISLNADEIHTGGLFHTPGMSPEKGRAYLDTIFAFLKPRLEVLWENSNNLSPCLLSSTENLPAPPPGLSVYPNPTRGFATIQVEEGAVIREARAYDLLGRLVLSEKEINRQSYTIQGTGLAKGVYWIHTRLDKGWRVAKVVFD